MVTCNIFSYQSFILNLEKQKKEAREESPAKLLDDLFRKTKATPCIYWLPLTNEQVGFIVIKYSYKKY